MTKTELENLKIGAICIFRRGHDAGKKCIVLYKKYDSILVETCDDTFRAINTNKKLRLTGFRELDICKSGRYPWED